MISHVDLLWTRAHTLERKEHCCLSLNASEDVVKGSRHKKQRICKSQIKAWCWDHEQCSSKSSTCGARILWWTVSFLFFVLRFLFTLSGVCKTWLFVVPFLFKCVPILFVFLFVGCTLSAMDFVCIMSAYHCCVGIQVRFQCFAIFVYVCVSCACIDWTVERLVSFLIVSGFFFFFFHVLAEWRRLFWFFSDWFLYLILGTLFLECLQRFRTAVSWL